MTAPNTDCLPPALLDAIAGRAITRQYAAHTILINEGDNSDLLFIVLSGRVKAFASDESGRDVVLHELGPGEYFGELSIDGGPRSVSVKTSEPSVCALVRGRQLHEFMAEHPDFALHLTHKLIRMARRLTEQVKNLALRDVYSRIVQLLNELSTAEGGERVLNHKLTQQDIAERIGSSREMVSRIFKELSAGGYVSVRTDRRIVIHKKLPLRW